LLDNLESSVTETDYLRDNLESSMEEADSLREETLHLNEELLRLELALMKANEAAKGSVETRTVYNINPKMNPKMNVIPKVHLSHRPPPL